MGDRHPDLLNAGHTAAFVVDVQENFRPHIHAFDEMVAAIELFLQGCIRLGVPIAASEQYPKGLGHTVPELAEVLDGAPLFEKLEISSCAAPGWSELPAVVRDRESIAIVGLEAHVCVSQTVLDLLHAGKRVHVVSDAVGSRDPWQHEMALQRLSKAGATITTVETALFELMECAGTPEFKDVQRMIKQYDAARHEPAGATPMGFAR